MRGSRHEAGPLVQEQSNQPVVNASVDSKGLGQFWTKRGLRNLCALQEASHNHHWLELWE